MGYIIMEKYLSDIVNNIEKSNNTEFPDPFYELEGSHAVYYVVGF